MCMHACMCVCVCARAHVVECVCVCACVHECRARGTTRAGRAKALTLFLPDLKNTWSIRACLTVVINGRIL